MRLLGLEHHEGETCLSVPIDILSIDITTAEGHTSAIAIDTVEIGRGFFHGDWSLLTNTGYWRSQRIASRAHPNDGRVDLVTVNRLMSFRQRLFARYRMRWGTHLPHPHMTIRQVESFSWDGPPLNVRVDGERFRAVTAIRVTVMPDAVLLYV
jgi:diacylglycerol kinase family enzyme